jgi:hypothetical protein
VRTIRRATRRFDYLRTLVAFAIAAATILVASGAGSAGTARVIQLKGHAGKALPQFRVVAPSTMFWTNSGSYFQISSGGGYCYDGAVTSEAHQGTSYIPPGRYRELRVAAIGDWTITIRPGVERVRNPITFSGTGQMALPPFRIRASKTMYWTNTGTVFQTYPANHTIAGTVSSQYHRGKTRLPAGRYRFFVNATAPEEPTGRWTIVFR